MSWLKRLKEGLSKSSGKITQGLADIIGKGDKADAAPPPEPAPAPVPEKAPPSPAQAEPVKAAEPAPAIRPPQSHPMVGTPRSETKKPEPAPPAPRVQENKKPAPPKEIPPAPAAPAEKIVPREEPRKEMEPVPEVKAETPKPSLVKKLQEKAAKAFTKSAALVTKRRLDDAMLAEIEEVLISADMGVGVAAELTEALSKDRFNKEVSLEEVRLFLAERIAALLAPVAKPLEIKAPKPFVVLMVGVNGNGKTTTLGKIASQWQDEGKKVILAACDTFRAAAVEQLSEWGRRAGVPVVTGAPQADPGSVAYQALEQARAGGADVLLVDTAGRLQNKEGLMEELAKIIRVLKKLDDAAPHATLLVLDATTGQNAHSQVEIFKSKVNITGLIITKLDGTAKGGVVVALAKRFGLPIHAVGVGETKDDLHAFRPEEFARSLMGL
jgi:fused signal recognition particle receptor